MHQHAIEVEHQGLTIRGSAYLPQRDGRHPAVLLLHGFTGQRIEAGFLFVQLARALNHLGVAAVTFDFRHSGESDGSFDQMLPSGELADALHMHRWLLGQPFVDRSRVGMVGMSLGGMIAASAAAQVDLRCLALLVPTDEANVRRFVGRPEPGQQHNFGSHVLHPGFLADLDQFDAVAAVTARPRPTLLVQATDDRAVPLDITTRYISAMQAARVPLEVLTIEGADHCLSHPRWRQQFFDRAPAWIASQLGATAATSPATASRARH